MSSMAAAHSGLNGPSPKAVLDVGIAAAALTGTVALLSHGGIAPAAGPPDELDLGGVVLAAGSTVPLLAWRRFPLSVFVVTAMAAVLMAALGYRTDLLLGPAASLYMLAAGRTPQSPWTRRFTAVVGVLFVAYLAATAVVQGGFPTAELLHTGAAWALAWFAGERTRLRREQIAELSQRALRVEHEAERERRLAAAEERARIARDLHDSAGHAINVIAVRAGAARLRYQEDPDRGVIALEAIEELARQTAEEIDYIVGTLRADDSSDDVVEAPPSLASIDTLIARHSEAGLDVTLETKGAVRPRGLATEQATYRILQEALTNAARHGTGKVLIELVFARSAVELAVTNAVRPQATERPGGGHGVVGMRERATRLGGSVETEQTDGVFRLRVRIPYGGNRG